MHPPPSPLCLRVDERTPKRGRRAEGVLDALSEAQSRLGAMAGALQQASHRHAIAGTAPQPRPSPPVTVDSQPSAPAASAAACVLTKALLKRGIHADSVPTVLCDAQSRVGSMVGALQQASRGHAIAGDRQQQHTGFSQPRAGDTT